MFDLKKALALSLTVLSGCATQGPYSVPKTHLPQIYPESRAQGATWTAADPLDLQNRGEWWRIYNEPELSDLESRVASENQSLQAVLARLRAARAQVSVARSAYFPTLGAGISASRQRTSADVTGRSLADKTVNDFSTGLTVSWEPDLFGKITHAVQAADARQEATAADSAALRLSVEAELAVDFFGLRDAAAQQRILQTSVDSFAHALQIVQQRFSVGIASDLEVAQAQTQLEAARTQLLEVGIQREQLQHAVATLVNQPKYVFNDKVADTVQPPVIPPGVPSQLLQRRPDVAAAERRVFAAYADAAGAHAAFFPDLVLAASGGRESSSLGNWLTLPARYWTLGPSIAGTIFDGGRRKAEASAADALLQEAAANYREVVLSSFQEVQDSLQESQQLHAEAIVQANAVAAAERALKEAMDRYRAGAVSYLDVVVAQTAALSNERTAADIDRRQLDASVMLIKALGGVWDSASVGRAGPSSGG